jgi:hypothetical protein
MRVRGQWSHRPDGTWLFRSGGRTHATVFYNRDWDKWVCWSEHLEGNDQLPDLKSAKARIMRRLRNHMERMYPLFA